MYICKTCERQYDEKSSDGRCPYCGSNLAYTYNGEYDNADNIRELNDQKSSKFDMDKFKNLFKDTSGSAGISANVKALIAIMVLITVVLVLVFTFKSCMDINDYTETTNTHIYDEDNIEQDGTDGEDIEEDGTDGEDIEEDSSEEYITVEGKQIKNTIYSENQEDTYMYTAPITGRFNFHIALSNVKESIEIYMFDENGNEYIDSYYSDEEDKAVDLEEGKTYIIQISSKAIGFDYTIDIGVPNESTEIKGNLISGKINYQHQINKYTYIAPVTGRYNLNFKYSSVKKSVHIYVYDERDETYIDHYYSDEENKDIDLEAGKKYYIEISSGDIDFEYNIIIGIPNKISAIKNNTITGKIEYMNQINQYLYIPTYTGNHDFTINLNNANTSIYIYMRDERDETYIDHYYSDEENKSVDLDAGKKYYIEISSGSIDLKYNISIN